MLLTEQKTTKLIHLIEELRRDMPMSKTGTILRLQLYSGR